MSESQDDKIIRRQQGMDSRETVPPDDTRLVEGPSDSDPSSAAAREAAKAADVQDTVETIDAVFNENRRAADAVDLIEEEHFARAAAHGGPSLVQPGRSRL